MTEEDERQERINEAAGKYFWPLVKAHKQRFFDRLQAIAPYRGSPRWEHERAAIDREWSDATVDAERVYHMAMLDLDTLGEVSEATSYAYDAVAAQLTRQELAA
jgi:hypothetical protein